MKNKKVKMLLDIWIYILVSVNTAKKITWIQKMIIGWSGGKHEILLSKSWRLQCVLQW